MRILESEYPAPASCEFIPASFLEVANESLLQVPEEPNCGTGVYAR
jgi:hypothetical protein